MNLARFSGCFIGASGRCCPIGAGFSPSSLQHLPYCPDNCKKIGANMAIGTTGQKFRAFEGLRGYMAWWVVFAHASQLTGLERILPARVLEFMDGGEPAVRVFIILSGFVITHLCMTQNESYGEYLSRRTLRIYPIYLVCLAFGIATLPELLAVHSTPWSIDPHMWQVRAASEHDNFWTHVFLHLTLLHGLVPDNIFPYSARTLLGPAWSLSLEWQFYLVAPFIVALVRRSKISMVLTIVALLGLCAVFRSGRVGAWEFPSMLLIPIPFFLVGILTRVFWMHLSRTRLSTILIVGCIAAAFSGPYKSQIVIWIFFVVAALREARPASVSPLTRALTWITSNRCATQLGKASYSTYLVHIPLLCVTISLALRIGGLHVQAVVCAAAVATLVVLIPISLMLYRFVEKPFTIPGIRRTGRAASQAGPAA